MPHCNALKPDAALRPRASLPNFKGCRTTSVHSTFALRVHFVAAQETWHANGTILAHIENVMSFIHSALTYDISPCGHIYAYGVGAKMVIKTHTSRRILEARRPCVRCRIREIVLIGKRDLKTSNSSILLDSLPQPYVRSWSMRYNHEAFCSNAYYCHGLMSVCRSPALHKRPSDMCREVCLSATHSRVGRPLGHLALPFDNF